MELITSGKLAKRWKVSRQRVNQWVNQGRLETAGRMNATWLFDAKVKKPAKLQIGRPKRTVTI